MARKRPSTSSVRSKSSSRKGFGRRLLRWAALVLVLWVVLTALPVLSMRWVNPFTSAFMLSARLEALAAKDPTYQTRYEWMDLDKMSPHAAMAVIAAEDQRFASHFGFDFKSIQEAMRHNSRGKRIRGASTISQQVAKNLFLWSGRSYFRKGLEAWFTVLIEALWPKKRILEVYLNIAEFGPGTYGVEAASRRYFSRSAAKLTREQAALLAAVLPNPLRFRVDQPTPYVFARRDWILGQMRGLGSTAYLERLEGVHVPRS